MTNEKWQYLKRQAEKRNVRFLKCDGVLYVVTKSHYPTGPSPLWSVDEVRPTEVPAFVPLTHSAEVSGLSTRPPG